MTTRLIHLSDMHCPARNPDQVAALIASVGVAAPDLVVVTGDLTRRGRSGEFASAAAILERLPGRKLIVPGNHDVPVAGLLANPFARFGRYFPQAELFLETEEVLVVGFNSAFGSVFSNWSLGNAKSTRVNPAAALLHGKLKGRLGIVACHHPLRPHSLDIKRSTTSRGPEAFEELALAGMRLLLHGHLHRTSKSCVEVLGLPVCELCANTALSDRERAGAAGYNMIDVTPTGYSVSAISWDGARYALSTSL